MNSPAPQSRFSIGETYGWPMPAAATLPNAKISSASPGKIFHDVLDTINPLEHIPIISSLYRAATGSQIAAGARIVGDTIYGGIYGFFSAVANTVSEAVTGKDIVGHVAELFTGDKKPAATATASAAASTPAGATGATGAAGAAGAAGVATAATATAAAAGTATAATLVTTTQTPSSAAPAAPFPPPPALPSVSMLPDEGPVVAPTPAAPATPAAPVAPVAPAASPLVASRTGGTGRTAPHFFAINGYAPRPVTATSERTPQSLSVPGARQAYWRQPPAAATESTTGSKGSAGGTAAAATAPAGAAADPSPPVPASAPPPLPSAGMLSDENAAPAPAPASVSTPAATPASASILPASAVGSAAAASLPLVPDASSGSSVSGLANANYAKALELSRQLQQFYHPQAPAAPAPVDSE
mgnify:CR=1 FL=1